MKTEEKSQNDSFYKVGIRLLSDVQLENVFPNYNLLLDKIERYREEAASMSHSNKEQTQYNLMYDNVFSILGKRGTGKTSVAFTLKKRIEENNRHRDVVLPIIIPEVIPDECSVLVWILAIVKENVKALEDRLQEHFKKNEEKNDYWSNCHYIKEGEKSLVDKVENLMGLLFAEKYNPSREASFYKAVGNSVRQAGDSYRFSCEVVKLWDEWIKKLKQLYQLEESSNDGFCPLIFFMFDDVDLEPQKVTELLSIIIKYLSHPNIIVITTAAEDMFLEVISNNLDKSIGRLPKEWRVYLSKNHSDAFWSEEQHEKKERDLITQTARMYLGKVLPTSTRYYLRLFGRTEEKCLFRLDTGLLGDVMCREVDELIALTKDDSQLNFLRSADGVLEFYLSFMGDTSRQIGNAYLAWRDLISSMEEVIQLSKEEMEKDIILDKIYNNCRYFLYVTINANHELAEEIMGIDEFVDEIFWLKFNGWYMYINYDYFSNYLMEMGREIVSEREGKERVIRIALSLYSLFMLLENILLILEKGIKDGITGRDWVHGISGMTDFLMEYAFDDRYFFQRGIGTTAFLAHYSKLLDKLAYIVSSGDCGSIYFYKEYLYSFMDVAYTEDMVSMLAVQKMMHENRAWLGEITGILAIVYGNIQVIEKREISMCKLYLGESFRSGYQEKIDKYLYSLLLKNMEDFGILEKAKIRISRLRSEVANQKQTECKDFEQVCKMIYKEVWEKNFAQLGNMENNDCVYIPVENILSCTIELYGEKTLLELLSMKNLEKENDVKGILNLALNRQEITIELLLKYKQEIELWDHYAKYMSIFDFHDWINKMYMVCNGNQQIRDLLDKILEITNEGKGQKPYRFFFFSGEIYKKLKNLLENFSIQMQYGIRNDDDKLQIEELEYFFRNVDVAVNISNSKDWKEAVSFCFKVLIYGKLQEIYIDQEILKKHRNRHRLSSAGLEKVKTGKDQEKSTYYHRLYQTMGKIISNRKTSTEALRSFLSQSAMWEIRKYYGALWKEVENEQRSH